MKWMQRSSCEQASRLLSRQRDEPLGAWHGVQLRLHLRICGDCRQVERQLALLGSLADGLGRADDGARRW